MTDWLLTPLSGASHHEIAPWAYWHARLMVLGWGVMLPLGAVAARYYKVTPGQDWPRALDNPRWWHAHRAFQWAGILTMTVGLAVAWGNGAQASNLAQIHAWAGWAVAVAGWLQIAAGFARGSKGGPTDHQLRGDHYDMTARRIAFERVHKSLGWLSICAAISVMVAGLILADAPRWMVLALAAWWLLIVAGCARLQATGRCIDTYYAIWGPDATHPGHQVRPTGWGVRRPNDR